MNNSHTKPAPKESPPAVGVPKAMYPCGPVLPLYTYSDLTSYAAAKVREALEEAAGVCEQTDEDGEGPDCWDWHAKDYARAIRALIPKD
jgi:hypothetical protein